ncbi:hypothetical protein BT93_G1010 [Corymbia citriodora subsp. variegata]|nr:hypothetical protein BT93_G1010 [Corymbia citriodora subsp. variegata]
MAAKMHFPSSTSSSSSLITIFCLLLVLISLFLPWAIADRAILPHGSNPRPDRHWKRGAAEP